MNVQDVITRVTRTFGDESAVQITEEDIIRWINDAQHEVLLHNPSVLEATSLVNLVKEQSEYSFPSDTLILRSLRAKLPHMESYQWLQNKNAQAFDRQISGWDGDLYGEGMPFIYTTYDRTIYLFPPPNINSTDGLKILYTQRPTNVVTATDSLDLPIEYHNAVVKYCLQQANALDEDLEASALYQAQFSSDVSRLSFQQQYGARETYPIITVNPDDRW